MGAPRTKRKKKKSGQQPPQPNQQTPTFPVGDQPLLQQSFYPLPSTLQQHQVPYVPGPAPEVMISSAMGTPVTGTELPTPSVVTQDQSRNTAGVKGNVEVCSGQELNSQVAWAVTILFGTDKGICKTGLDLYTHSISPRVELKLINFSYCNRLLSLDFLLPYQRRSATMSHQEPIFLSKNTLITNESFPRLRGKVISDYTPDIFLLRTSLLSDWKLHGEVEFTSGPDGTFLIQFDKLDDLLNVWRGAPWFYQDDLFLLQPDTGTTTHELQFRKAGFWVRFDNLTSEYLSTSSASSLACRIGVPLEYSIKPELGILEVLVQIDITKPLIRSLQVVLDDGSHVLVSVNYVRLPRLCSLCGVPGHRLESCRKRNPLKLILKNFLGSCLPRYRSKDVFHLEHTSPTGHTSNNIMQSINGEHTRDVSKDLMSDVTPSTGSGIQVPAMQDSTQDEDSQIDVFPADQAFDPQGRMSHDYSVQLYSFYITQGPSFLRRGEDTQLYSDLGATTRRMELVIVISHLPRELTRAAFRSVAACRGVESVTLANTEPALFLVIGIGLDDAMIMEDLRRKLNRAARSNTNYLNTRFHVTLDMPSSSWSNILSRLGMSSNTEPNSTPARVQEMAKHLLDVLGNTRYSR
ncbi:hypothetical protein ACQ4PT_065776 [Festuca glaucescens]